MFLGVTVAGQVQVEAEFRAMRERDVLSLRMFKSRAAVAPDACRA